MRGDRQPCDSPSPKRDGPYPLCGGPTKASASTTVSGMASASHEQAVPSAGSGKVGKERQQKLGFLRKKDRGRSTPTPTKDFDDEDDDDEWLVEGMSTNGQVNATVSVGREASTLSSSVHALPEPETTAVPIEKKRTKGRSLAKKTSRLFGRSNGHSQQDDSSTGGSTSTLPIPPSGPVRQSSFSSTASGDTAMSATRSKHWSITRVSTRGSPPHRASTESQPSSWHPPPTFSLRRTSSSSADPPPSSFQPVDSQSRPPSNHPKLRHRESAQQLGASGNGGARSQPPATAPVSSSLGARQETLPSRMSSWLSNLLPSNDGSPSSQVESPQAAPPSPLRKGPSAAASFFSAARNKAVGGMRYLLDSDAQPDRCQDTMWVMGVGHPGWTPDGSEDSFESEQGTPGSRNELAPPPAPSWTNRLKDSSATYSSAPPTKFGQFFGSSMNLAQQANAEPSTPPPDSASGRSRNRPPQKEVLSWPDQFYDDFRSRVWCTYRSQYAPILTLSQDVLLPNPESYFGAFSSSEAGNGHSVPHNATAPSRLSNTPWAWNKEERGLTSDAGWGCMLRTGQSMLANALIHLHLGRDWRLSQQKPTTKPQTSLELAELEAYATYVRLLSWFLDDPSPLCPFSVHRMALIGKELGKEVGEWFGPSTAAGALKTLANSFPICGLSVATAVDGTIYRTDVYTASNISSESWVPGGTATSKPRPNSIHRTVWGGKAVLILIGLRLGLDGVNPIYFDSIKELFTFPQSVGIAGGRPSSSYYFVASQANSLFYLDPHFTRNAVPLKVPPASVATPTKESSKEEAPKAASKPSIRASMTIRGLAQLEQESDESEDEEEETGAAPNASFSGSSVSVPVLDVVNVDDTSNVSEWPPQPKHKRRLTATQPLRIVPEVAPVDSELGTPTTPTLSAPQRSPHPSPSPARPTAHSTTSSTSSTNDSFSGLPVDSQTSWYASAYPDQALRTFHCDKVKKLPLSGLDPSMLLGFLCQTEAEFDDFCERIAKLPYKIFNVQDEPPMWSEDEDGALESVSEQFSESEASDDDLEASMTAPAAPVSGDVEEVDEFGRISQPRSTHSYVGAVPLSSKTGTPRPAGVEHQASDATIGQNATLKSKDTATASTPRSTDLLSETDIPSETADAPAPSSSELEEAEARAPATEELSPAAVDVQSDDEPIHDDVSRAEDTAPPVPDKDEVREDLQAAEAAELPAKPDVPGSKALPVKLEAAESKEWPAKLEVVKLTEHDATEIKALATKPDVQAAESSEDYLRASPEHVKAKALPMRGTSLGTPAAAFPIDIPSRMPPKTTASVISERLGRSPAEQFDDLGRDAEEVLDRDDDFDELGSTPSSIPVLVERPSLGSSLHDDSV